MKRKKLIIIGIDGATPQLLYPWALSGKLDYFNYLIKNGCYGNLQSTIHPLSPCAWSSILTGTNPGKHSIFGFFKKVYNDYDFTLVDSRERALRDFYEIMSYTGLKVLIANVPFTFPPRKVNGILIAGLGTKSSKNNFTYPKELKQRLLTSKVPYPLTNEFINYDNEEKFFNSLSMAEKLRFQWVKKLFFEIDADVLFYVFELIDRLQHIFIGAFDNQYPIENVRGNQRFQNFIFNAYLLINNLLRDFINSLKDDFNLFIISDHGASPLYGNFNLFKWLLDKDYLYPSSIDINNKILLPGKTKFKNYINIFERYKGVKNLPPSFISQKFLLDWDKSKTFIFDTFGNIYINLKNREKEGIVEPSNYQSVCSEIANNLMKLRNPYNNELLISTVYHKNEIYNGDYVNEAPDLIIKFNNYNFITTMTLSLEENELFLPPKKVEWNQQLFYTGTHNIDGIFIGVGIDLPSKNKILGMHIYDLAPTFLSLYNIEPLNWMDGKSFLNSKSKISLNVKPHQPRLNKNIYKLNEKLLIELKNIGYF